MHVWIIQTGEPMFTDGSNLRPMRAMNLANKLLDSGHKVTIFTSNFDHFTKNKRFPNQRIVEIKENLQIVFVDGPGYSKNISLKRFWDHAVTGYRMKKTAQEMKIPDVAFIGYPPIEAAWFMSKICQKLSVPYILDVKDAWPHVIIDAFPGPVRPVLKFLLYPYFTMFRSAVRNSSHLCSISDSFLKWSQIEGKSESEGDFVAYLTSQDSRHEPKEYFEAKSSIQKKLKLDSKKLTIYFVGSLTRNFDFEPILGIAKKNKVNLIIAGDGAQLEFLLDSAKNYENIFIIGRVNQLEAKVISELSDIAIVPMKDLNDFKMSIPNKFFDYMLNEKPILSSLDGDSRALIERHKIGYYYENSENLEKIIDSLNDDRYELTAIGNNGRRTYSEIFAYDHVYNLIVSKLEKLAAKSDV